MRNFIQLALILILNVWVKLLISQKTFFLPIFFLCSSKRDVKKFNLYIFFQLKCIFRSFKLRIFSWFAFNFVCQINANKRHNNNKNRNKSRSMATRWFVCGITTVQQSACVLNELLHNNSIGKYLLTLVSRTMNAFSSDRIGSTSFVYTWTIKNNKSKSLLNYLIKWDECDCC